MKNNFAKGSSVRFANTPYNPVSAYISANNVNLDFKYKSDPRDFVSTLGNPWNLPTTINYLPIYIRTGAKIHGEGVWE
jgi:hypothetical protein